MNILLLFSDSLKKNEKNWQTSKSTLVEKGVSQRRKNQRRNKRNSKLKGAGNMLANRNVISMVL